MKGAFKGERKMSGLFFCIYFCLAFTDKVILPFGSNGESAILAVICI